MTGWLPHVIDTPNHTTHHPTHHPTHRFRPAPTPFTFSSDPFLIFQNERTVAIGRLRGPLRLLALRLREPLDVAGLSGRGLGFSGFPIRRRPGPAPALRRPVSSQVSDSTVCMPRRTGQNKERELDINSQHWTARDTGVGRGDVVWSSYREQQNSSTPTLFALICSDRVSQLGDGGLL